MDHPLQIAFRGMEASKDIEELVRKRAEKLNTFAAHLMSCRVVVQPAGRHHRHGNLFQVHLDIRVPGEEIAISHDVPEHVDSKQLEVAVRDAFDAAQRRLDDYARRRRGEVKTHNELLRRATDRDDVINQENP